MALPEPANIATDMTAALFDAAMACIGLGVHGAIAAQFGIREELPDIIMQAALIAFQGEHVIGFAGHDAGRDGGLCPHGVDADDQAFESQHGEQFRDGRDLVALGINRRLAKHQTSFAGIGRNHVQDLVCGLVWDAARVVPCHQWPRSR